jgi:hypothetical protein
MSLFPFTSEKPSTLPQINVQPIPSVKVDIAPAIEVKESPEDLQMRDLANRYSEDELVIASQSVILNKIETKMLGENTSQEENAIKLNAQDIFEAILEDISTPESTLLKVYNTLKQGKTPVIKELFEQTTSIPAVFTHPLFQYSYNERTQSLVIKSVKSPDEVIEVGLTDPPHMLEKRTNALGISYWKGRTTSAKPNAVLTIEDYNNAGKSYTKYNYNFAHLGKATEIEVPRIDKNATNLAEDFSQAALSAPVL